MNTGCPRPAVRDTALQLLQLLDKRFFGAVGPLAEGDLGKFVSFSVVNNFVQICWFTVCISVVDVTLGLSGLFSYRRKINVFLNWWSFWIIVTSFWEADM